MRTVFGGTLLLAVASVASGCATQGLLRPLVQLPSTGQTRCKVAASQGTPLVTEWPASEKANLESLVRRGAVAVAYSGCSMRVLPQCRVAGSYTWQRTSPATDVLEISNEDELYAKLPLGAASLEGELKRWGKLSMLTQVSGQLRLEGPGMIAPDPECAHATHVVTALSVGAFTLSAGAGASAAASGQVNAVITASAGGRAGSTLGVVKAAGDAQSCGLAGDDAPHPNCRSPIQVFLGAIPGRAGEEGPPGTIKVDLVSAAANSRWDVYVDDNVICTTPCSRWLHPDRPVFLRSREDSFGPPDKIRLTRLGGYQEPLQLQAHPTDRGKFVTGMTFTSFGGMGTLAGLMLTGIGCGGRRPEMCPGGLITLGTGALVTAGAIWLMLDAMPKAELLPAGGDAGPTFVVSPFGTAGRF